MLCQIQVQMGQPEADDLSDIVQMGQPEADVMSDTSTDGSA